MSSKNLPEPQSEILIYQTEDGQAKVQVRLQDETVWLSQRLMAELFQKDVRTINEHIKNIYEESELQPESTIRNFRIVQTEGKHQVFRDIDFYNLDVIISVGCQVKSHCGTQFRIWATKQLREYIIKGFALDDERLKQDGGSNYFDELLACIHKPMYMQDWIAKLDDFLRLSEWDILTHAGNIRRQQALEKTLAEYEKYREQHLNDESPIERHFIEAVKM